MANHDTVRFVAKNMRVDLRLIAERRRGVHEAAETHDTHHAVEIAAERALGLRQKVETAQFRRFFALL